MQYSRIKLLGFSPVFPDGKVGDVVTTEWPTARHLISRKIAEMIDPDIAASAAGAAEERAPTAAPTAATVEPAATAELPQAKGRKPTGK